MTVVEAKFALLQVQLERVFGHTMEGLEAGFGKVPEGLDAVDMGSAQCKLILAVAHAKVPSTSTTPS